MIILGVSVLMYMCPLNGAAVPYLWRAVSSGRHRSALASYRLRSFALQRQWRFVLHRQTVSVRKQRCVTTIRWQARKVERQLRIPALPRERQFARKFDIAE